MLQPATAQATAVDIERLPVTTTAVPAFPYIDYPSAVNKALRRTSESAFQSVGVIVGDKIRTVEGRRQTSNFDLVDAKLSQELAHRDYDKAIRALGAVKVNSVTPQDPRILAANGNDPSAVKSKLLSVARASYDAYVVRTPTARAWIVLMVTDREVTLLAIEEKNVEAAVALVNAGTMKSELDTKGRVALYINFDTDKASVRPDAQATIDQIVLLLKQEPNLKLSIEGHTDNTGDAKRNRQLSTSRAQAVASALQQAGIGAARLSAVGYGADKPLGSNNDEAGRAKNRRVELVKVTKG
ncbi:OmpA family protein [Massilia sp. CF038]|uniref:OmpA family protein n=1 Tax=Massilia sp. CF038 TaxID=1881045 RepID=UPI0015B497EC|nr:OmpA family protein [Massilia sp. CF038]